MTAKVLVAPVGSLEAHCVALALRGEGIDVTCVPSDDVQAIVLFATGNADLSAAELFEDDGDRPVLMVSPELDGPTRELARRAGAATLVAWDCPTERLASVIRRLAAGERGIAPGSDVDPLGNLTDRERDIVMLLREGASNEAIASALGISYHTVRTHVTHVLSKLGVSHRYAVAAMARGGERLPTLNGAGASAGGAA